MMSSVSYLSLSLCVSGNLAHFLFTSCLSTSALTPSSLQLPVGEGAWINTWSQCKVSSLLNHTGPGHCCRVVLRVCPSIQPQRWVATSLPSCPNTSQLSLSHCCHWECQASTQAQYQHMASNFHTYLLGQGCATHNGILENICWMGTVLKGSSFLLGQPCGFPRSCLVRSR